MPVPISRTALPALRALSLAYFVQATGALAVVGSLAAIGREWTLSDSQGALLISVFGVTFALAAPLFQVAIGHLPRRRQVLIGLSLFSVAAVLFAASPGFAALLASRVLMGLGAALIGPVLGALGAGLVEREQQGSAIATVLLGLSMSGMLGMPLSAWVAHAWGARALFLIVGATGVASALMIARLVPAQAGAQKVSLAALGQLLRDAVMLPALLVVLFVAAGVYTTYAFIVPIVRDVFHGGAQVVSIALAILGVAGVLGNLFVVRAARRYSADAMLFSGIALLAADLLFLLACHAQLGLLYVALLFWAFATDIVWPSQQRRIVELAPELRGIALALTASFVFCGIGLGSAVAGLLYPRFGYAGNLLGSLAFLLLATASLALSRRRAAVGAAA